MTTEAKKNAYLYCKFRDEQLALYDEYAKRHGMLLKTLLVVNALRFRPHPSHFNVGEALALIARVAPRRALITHVSHEIGRHAATTALLPRGVELAYDGLEIII